MVLRHYRGTLFRVAKKKGGGENHKEQDQATLLVALFLHEVKSNGPETVI